MSPNETYYGYEKIFTKEEAIKLLEDKIHLLNKLENMIRDNEDYTKHYDLNYVLLNDMWIQIDYIFIIKCKLLRDLITIDPEYQGIGKNFIRKFTYYREK